MLKATHLSIPKTFDAALPCLLILLAGGYVAFYWSNPVALSPDSNSYLTFGEARTAGYPVFIMLIEAVFGTIDAVPTAQLVIAAAAFTFLGWSLGRAFQTPFYALLPVLTLMLYPGIADVHSYILTESLFISLLCLLTGIVMLIVRRPTWYLVAASALICGLAITVRPAGISLLVIWPFLFWLIWRRCESRRIVLVTAVIVTIVLCLLLENMAWHVYHDSESRPNLADRHLFAKALIIEAEPQISDPELASLVARGRGVSEPGREAIDGAPNHYARARLLANIEVAAQYTTYRREFAHEVNEIAQQRGIGEYDVLAKVGRSVMLKAPGAWIENALSHYWSLWLPYWSYGSPANLDEYQAYIENMEPSPILVDASVFRQLKPRGLATRSLLRLTMAVGLVSTTLAVVLATWQRLHGNSNSPDRRLVIASVAGLAIHTHFLMVGLLGVATSRYAVAMGPLLATCAVLLGSWGLEQVRHVEWGRLLGLAKLSRRAAH